jgi:acetyltransferase-like isoleucine patch superfamily enzyme
MGNIIMGKGSYSGNPIHHRFSDCDITIGKFCSIALNLKIFTGGNHRHDWITTYPFSTRFPFFNEFGPHQADGKPVTIGNDVWIGDDVVIMSGVEIGDGSCIGAHSVVRRNITPYSIVRGNPAREVRKRFSHDEIVMLLRMKWWDWAEAKIFEAMKFLLSSDIEGLYRYYGTNVYKEPSSESEQNTTLEEAT